MATGFTRGTRAPAVRLACVCVLCAVSTASAGTIYVDDDALLGGNGTSWATAYKYLQDALVTAVTADQIRVAQGTYKPDQDEAGNVTPGDRAATFRLVSGWTPGAGEGGASLEVRVLPDGRGGGAPKVVRRHPGTHRATTRNCGWLDTLGMTQQVAQTGPRCDNLRGCPAPITRNVAEKPLGRARRGPFQPVRPEETRRQARSTGGRCTMGEHGPVA